jgi:hypothetical protein
VSALSSFEQAIVSTGPAGAWRFRDYLAEPLMAHSTANSNATATPYIKGTINTTATFPANVPSTGVFNQSVRRFGTNNYFHLDTPASYRTAQFSFACVVFPYTNGVVAKHHMLAGCSQAGGWAARVTANTQRLDFLVYRSGNYATVIGPDYTVFPTDQPLFVVCRYDLRFIKIDVNGVPFAADMGNNANCTYGAADIPILLGIDPAAGGAPDSSQYNYDNWAHSHYAHWARHISDSEIALMWDKFRIRRQVGGNAKLDTGAAAERVRIFGWNYPVVGETTPLPNGDWIADVDDIQVGVTTIGPTGYQPITHGPLTPVEVV